MALAGVFVLVVTVVAIRADTTDRSGAARGAFDCLAGSGYPGDTHTAPPGAAPTHHVARASTVDAAFAGVPEQQAIVTHGVDQYVGYYNRNRQLTLAHRRLPDGAWQLRMVPGSDATTNWDSHDSVALGVDSRGNLHVAANMHAVPLRYWRTGVPGELDSLHRVRQMSDAGREALVTYPQFIVAPAGQLVFSYREGRSGSGTTYFLGLDAATERWTLLDPGAVFDGRAGRSAYVSTRRGADGYFYLSFVWRSSGDVASNSRLSLVRTRDFRSWQTVDGRRVRLPITYTTPGVVVDDVAEHHGLFNDQEQIGTDAAGRVSVAYTKYDPAGTAQLYLAAHVGGDRWTVAQLTHWTGRWTVAGYDTLAVPVTFTAPTVVGGRTVVTFTCRGVPRALDIDRDAPFQVDNVAGASALPGELLRTYRSDPGLRADVDYDRQDLGGDYFALKWDSLGFHGDRPRARYPSAGPIVVYDIRAG